jgi:tRNA-modifying protein YgfZ
MGTRLALLIATGNDRLRWLNGLVTCDVLKLNDGGSCYGLVTSRTGKVISDVWLWRSDPNLFIASSVPIYEHLEAHIIMEDVDWVLPTERSATLTWEARASDDAATSTHAPSQAFTVNLAGAMARIVYGDIHAPSIDSAGPLPDTFEEDAAREQRIALGVPRFGIDFDATNLPHEASLEHVAVAFDKGCYLGQEVVCMVEMRGQVQKRLVRLHGASPLAGEVTSNGDVVGTVRSSAKTNVGFAALALVRRKALEQGKPLAVANVPVTSELILQPTA